MFYVKMQGFGADVTRLNSIGYDNKLYRTCTATLSAIGIIYNTNKCSLFNQILADILDADMSLHLISVPQTCWLPIDGKKDQAV